MTAIYINPEGERWVLSGVEESDVPGMSRGVVTNGPRTGTKVTVQTTRIKWDTHVEAKEGEK